MRTSILDTRVMKGADVYNEHYLVKTRMDGEEVDDVEELTYQEAIVDKECRGSKDIMHHLEKVCGPFQTLRRV